MNLLKRIDQLWVVGLPASPQIRGQVVRSNGNRSGKRIARYRLSISANIQNLFNRAQWGGYNTVLSSRNFLQPTSAAGVRRINISVGLSF